MAQDNMIDFGTLYRSAFAERDPERKQMLLSQVQRAITISEQDETTAVVKLGPQSEQLSKVRAIA
jgi:hypothetical protein